MKKLLFLFVVVTFVSCQTGAKKENNNDAEPASVKLVESTINISGMHCEMCVSSVEKGVSELVGIESVDVSLNDSTAVVKYDESKLELAEIEKAIEKRGYKIKDNS